MGGLETDYLVVGAGLSGLGFVDALLAADPDAEVVVVDRRDRPGGHWLDAYPFVRLHLPSAFYGVASRPLGGRAEDDEGLAERASGTEVLAHLTSALDDHVATGRVRFVGMHGHEQRPDGTSVLVNRISGRAVPVVVRRALVDAAYTEGEVPATHRRSFAVDDDARCVPVGDLTRLGAPGERYTVLGAGKTAMDAVTWLLGQGVAPERLRWVRPRDAWVLDRRGLQPHDGVAAVLDGFSRDVEAVSVSSTLPELMARLEGAGRLLRLDASVEPSMYHCAIVGPVELERLRAVDDVVRLGRVRSVCADRLVLDEGEVASTHRDVVVDCTARGLSARPPKPVFTAGRITVQQVRPCSPAFSSALIGHIAAVRDDTAEQNALCPALPVPQVPADWLVLLRGGLDVMNAWRKAPDVQAWIDGCRLDVAHGLPDHLGDPAVQAASARFGEHLAPALERLRAGFAPQQRRAAEAAPVAGG